MLTITYWEDESTVCYHQEVTGIVISRRRGKHHSIDPVMRFC